MNDGSVATLYHSHKHSDLACRVGDPNAVSHSGLRLHRKRHRRRDVVNVANARRPRVAVKVFDVSSTDGDCLIDDAEHDPRDHELHGVNDDLIAPSHFDERREKIGEVHQPTFRYLDAGDVKLAAL